MSNDLTFVVKSGGLPPGAYPAEFLRAEPYEEHAEQYGPGVMLVWRVTSGEQAGAEVSRICSRKMSAKSTLYKFATALRGAPLEPGTTFSFTEVVGAKGTLILEPTDGGGGRVSAFIRG